MTDKKKTTTTSKTAGYKSQGSQSGNSTSKNVKKAQETVNRLRQNKK